MQNLDTSSNFMSPVVGSAICIFARLVGGVGSVCWEVVAYWTKVCTSWEVKSILPLVYGGWVHNAFPSEEKFASAIRGRPNLPRLVRSCISIRQVTIAATLWWSY